MFKKVLLTTTLLLISISCFSFTQTADDNFTSFFQPNNQTAWFFTGSALYTKSSDKDYNDYLYSPPWNWGFKIKAGYELSKAKSISLSWLNFSETDRAHEDVITDLFGEGETTITASFKEVLNIVNFDLHQQIDFNNRIVFDLEGGLEYFKYKRHLALEFQSNVSLSEQNSNADFNYHGVGPRIGIGFDFALFNNIHLISSVAYSSIFYRIGERKVNLTRIDRTGPNPINSSWRDVTKDRGPIGGEDGEVGVDYSKHVFQGDLTLRFSFLGIAYSIDDARYEMFTLGAKWRANT